MVAKLLILDNPDANQRLPFLLDYIRLRRELLNDFCSMVGERIKEIKN